jgi:hypothetical protein
MASLVYLDLRSNDASNPPTCRNILEAAVRWNILQKQELRLLSVNSDDQGEFGQFLQEVSAGKLPDLVIIDASSSSLTASLRDFLEHEEQQTGTGSLVALQQPSSREFIQAPIPAAIQLAMLLQEDRSLRATREKSAYRTVILGNLQEPLPPIGGSSTITCAIDQVTFLDLPLLREILRLATSPIPAGSTVPDSVRDLPPSPWGLFSLADKYFRDPPYVQAKVSDQEAAELGSLSSLQQYKGLFEQHFGHLAGIGDKTPERQRISLRRNILFTLRVCRRLAFQTVEGRPLQSTVVLTAWDDDKKQRLLGEGGSYWECLPFVDKDKSVPVFLARLRELAEIAQSDALFLLIDVQRCTLHPIVVRQEQLDDFCRIRVFRRILEDWGGLLFHMRERGIVEVYDHNEMQLRHDGFRWSAKPYDLLRKELSGFFGDGPAGDQLTRRVVGAIASLLDMQASSLLAFIPKDQALDRIGEKKLLRQMHHILDVNAHHGSRAEPATLGPVPPIKKMPLDALVSLLRVDGVHIITERGELLLAHRVTDFSDTASSALGTGRWAAERLSREFPNPKHFVVKVSSSRNVHIYKGGDEMPPAS